MRLEAMEVYEAAASRSKQGAKCIDLSKKIILINILNNKH